MPKGYDIFCSLIVLYKDNEILLQHRTEDAKRLPGYWAFFGGGIKNNETPLQAVVREAKEELSYDLVSPKLFIETDFKINSEQGHLFLFIEEHNPAICLVQNEGQAMRWLDETHMDNLKMIDHDRIIAKALFGYVKALNQLGGNVYSA